MKPTPATCVILRPDPATGELVRVAVVDPAKRPKYRPKRCWECGTPASRESRVTGKSAITLLCHACRRLRRGK